MVAPVIQAGLTVLPCSRAPVLRALGRILVLCCQCPGSSVTSLARG